jgi:hypothetical protein
MTSSRLLLPLTVALLCLLTGCGTSGVAGADHATGEEQGQELADQLVFEEAEELAGDLRGVAWLQQAVYLEVQVPLRRHEEYPDTDLRRTLLISEGSTDESGDPVVELVARIRVHLVPGNTADWDPPGEATVARCFSYEVVREEVDWTGAECPDAEPIRVDTSIRVPQRPEVRPRDDAAIRAFLRRGGDAADLAVLQERLNRGLTARVTDEGGVTAVAVTARPDGDDCALGRRGPEGRVDVWHPDRVQTMPGEMGCVPELVTHPPL